MPQGTEPPIFGWAVLMLLRPGALVMLAPPTPASPRVPARTAPAPRARPPARNARRSNSCDIATPQRSRTPRLRKNDDAVVGDGGRLQLHDRLRVAGGWMATWAPPPHGPRPWFPAHRDQDQDGEAEERREHMAIAVGDKVPDVKVWTFGDKGPEATTSAEVLGRGKVVLFGVPGAFTPTCSDHHLPGFVLRADELRAKGADRVVCVSVNDPFVMGAWGEDQKVGDSVVMLSDGNGELAEAMGLTMDGSGFGLGSRIQRFAAVIEDGVVTWLAVEPGPGLHVSSGEEVLEAP